MRRLLNTVKIFALCASLAAFSMGCSSSGREAQLAKPNATPRVITDPALKEQRLAQLATGVSPRAARSGGMPANAAPMSVPAAESAPSSITLPATSSETESAATGGPIVAEGLLIPLEAPFEKQKPSSAMRKGQAIIPARPDDVLLTVFHFGVGGGGGVDANLDRWVGQMDLTRGTSPVRETFTNAHGLTVHTVYAEGTLRAGMSNPESKPDSALYGAVVEGDGGPWFLKVVGPKRAITEHRERLTKLYQQSRLAE